ncbi:CDT1-like protein a, chloroplastic [Panicum miliaceum]|uniref:CDT1-like protein a, chloroplastic n=1 Tax=Panicum miliaceum TaxID=4540 RepID=A0A3L6QGC3_PANMI|nr:CDT1-like protein a, chloroplastic [Panicum miliaceum]
MEMDAGTPSKKAKTSAAAGATPQKPWKAAPGDQILTPEKLAPRVTVAAAAEQIWTPEKPEEMPRARSRSVAFSVKEVRRAALGLRRQEKGTPAAAEEADELESLERELGVGAGASQSPVKRKAEVKLPESYEMLCEFFNCLESSTRLLRMKGSKASFPNICASIQHLSERRFTYSHLAQLKYVMPEAIVINKILLRDDTTCCMKPDLQVNLVVGAVESVKKQKGETAYSALRRIFRQRLVDFFRDHPEGDDIPEHELPHPFNRTRLSMPQAAPRVVPEPASPIDASDVNGQQATMMSHMSQSFKRRNSLSSSYVSASKEAQPEVDDKVVVSMSGVSEGTPAKYASTPVRLMASTPDLKTPKRPISDAGYGTPPLKMSKRSARAKLFTTPTKVDSMDGENQNTISAVDSDDELLSFLPQSLLQSVKQKEQRAMEEKETGFSDKVKRQKLIASLPSVFDVVFLIYQSRQRVDATLSQADIRQRLYAAE